MRNFITIIFMALAMIFTTSCESKSEAQKITENYIETVEMPKILLGAGLVNGEVLNYEVIKFNNNPIDTIYTTPSGVQTLSSILHTLNIDYDKNFHKTTGYVYEYTVSKEIKVAGKNLKNEFIQKIMINNGKVIEELQAPDIDFDI